MAGRGAAIVTGGARGIGAAIARQWVARGGSVLIADIDDDAGVALADELGAAGLARYLHCDVTDEMHVGRAFEVAQSELGALAAVFANAGAVGVTGPIAETSLTDWRATTDLLLTSVFLAVRDGVRAMTPRAAGAIVVTASVASARGGLGPHVYTAAKSGVRGLVESVAVEVAGKGLTINAVAPGGTVSSLAAGLLGGSRDDLETARGRLAHASSSGVPTTAEDVASAALFLASPAARRVNGATLVIDGGDTVLGSIGRQYYS